MLNLIANVLLFIVLVIGVWTIVCMVYKMPWVYDLFSQKPYKQVKLEVWIATDEDGSICLYCRKPKRFYGDEGGKWTNGNYLMCANNRIELFGKTPDITWEDEPLKATLTIDATATDYEKAKIHEIDLMYGTAHSTGD